MVTILQSDTVYRSAGARATIVRRSMRQQFHFLEVEEEPGSSFLERMWSLLLNLVKLKLWERLKYMRELERKLPDGDLRSTSFCRRSA